MEKLFALLQAIKPVPPALQEDLLVKTHCKKISKSDYLLREGSVCSRLYFIENGLFRCFYHVNEQPVSSWFMVTGDMLISVKSFYRQIPSEENIQAMEDSTVYYIDYHDLQYLYNKHPEFNYHSRVLTENYYIQCEDRLLSMREKPAKDRYQYLLNNHPHLIQKVPAKDLASYLGISQFTFSRMKKD